MKKQNLITIVAMCLFSVLNAKAQDIIYTISGEVENQKTPLKSILFENLTNDTRLIFHNLPEQEEYVINLNAQQILNGTGINENRYLANWQVSKIFLVELKSYL